MSITSGHETPRQRHPTRRHALYWAQQGWPVIPCKPDKSPYPEHGKDEATTDEIQIMRWWADRPFALVGGRCDGKVVLDLDAYKPGHAADLARLPDLPPTRTHRTRGGGTHLIFLDSAGSFRSGKLGPTIDVRAGTSRDYVILPAPGTGYEVERDQDPIEAPAALREFVGSPPVNAETPGEQGLPEPAPLPDGYRPRDVSDKGISEQTYWLIYSGVQDGLSDGQLLTLAEQDPVTSERRAAGRRQQPHWWTNEFWRCVNLAREAPTEKRRPAADVLLEIANRHYVLGLTAGDDPFATPRDGPNVARIFRGKGGFRSEMAYRYKQQTGKAPNQNALTDAIAALEGEARQQPKQDLPLRVAWHGGELVLDLGTEDGRAVVIGPGGWKVVDRSPVLFLRTPLTGELPEPQRGGQFSRDLFPFLNVAKADRRLFVACQVSLLWPDIAHPVVSLTGEEGTAKSTVARVIRSLSDPSLVETRRSPGRDEDWEVTIAGQWLVVLDNLSTLPDWLSDAMCCAVYGTGSTKRKLYTDADLTAQRVRRAFILTSIDSSLVSRGDLVGRAVQFDLDPIRKYRTETELAATWERARPLALGALLDLASGVLQSLPAVQPSAWQDLRMSDFARLVAAMDLAAPGTATLARYREKIADSAADALSSDPLAMEIAKLADRNWQGTTTALYDKVVRPNRLSRTDKTWPKDAQALGMRLRRISGLLRRSGVEISNEHTRNGKVWTVTRIAGR